MPTDRDQPSRIFGLIPAAGLSRRMGSPKLLLPWGDCTVIEQLLRTLHRPEITATVVVVRSSDTALLAVIGKTSAISIVPEHDPPDMRDSIELGLAALRDRFQPRDSDGWLLIPADHPVVEPEVLDGLFAHWFANHDLQVLVPKFGNRRGHPALLRWSLADRIAQLPAHVGINELWKTNPALITEWPTHHESILIDLDTPADYSRWRPNRGR